VDSIGVAGIEYSGIQGIHRGRSLYLNGMSVVGYASDNSKGFGGGFSQ
jgi:hypothetical protein